MRVEPAGIEAAERPPLLFLHEGLGSIDLWRTFPDDVRAATGDPAMVVYSRHGYGRSVPVTEPRPVTYMHVEADEVLPALLDHLGLVRPLLVGHSDGASIALLHAGAGHPNRRSGAARPARVRRRPLDRRDRRRSRAYDGTDLPAADGAPSRRRRRHVPRVERRLVVAPFRSWDITDRLGAVDVPILVVQGTDDEYGTLAQLDAIDHGVRGPVTRLVLPGAGHAPHLDAPAATLAAVATFINALLTTLRIAQRPQPPENVLLSGHRRADTGVVRLMRVVSLVAGITLLVTGIAGLLGRRDQIGAERGSAAGDHCGADDGDARPRPSPGSAPCSPWRRPTPTCTNWPGR